MVNESLLKTKKSIALSSIIVLICFLISSFCFFINQIWIPLGFIIGLIISIINTIFLYKFSYYLTRPYAKYKWLNFLSVGTRLLLYGVGFAICIIPQSFGYNIFFWGTCLASYMIMIISIIYVFRK